MVYSLLLLHLARLRNAVDMRDNPIVDELPAYLQNVYQFKQLPVYTINHPGNHEILKSLRRHLKNNHKQDPLLIGEVWVPDLESLRQFYGERDNEIQLPFNFFLSTVPTLDANRFRETIRGFEEFLGDMNTIAVLFDS